MRVEPEAEAKTLPTVGVEHAGDLRRLVTDDEWFRLASSARCGVDNAGRIGP